MDAFFDKTEKLLTDWNLTHPGKRMLVGATAGLIVAYLLQPASMFYEGRPRPFAPFADPKSAIPATNYPWWILPVAGAAVLGMFI